MNNSGMVLAKFCVIDCPAEPNAKHIVKAAFYEETGPGVNLSSPINYNINSMTGGVTFDLRRAKSKRQSWSHSLSNA